MENVSGKSDNEISINVASDAVNIQKLLDDKNKARNYIKSCKNIIKKQSDQLKKQQNEFKNAVSTLETQSFTTRFHSVAFKLELDVMRLINIRRRIDSVIKKKYFLKFAAQIFKIRDSEYLKFKGAYSLLRLSIENIVRYIKNKRNARFKLGFFSIKNSAALKSPNSFKSKFEMLKKENFSLKSELTKSNKNASFDEVLEENKKLKEKLKSTEQSVGNFIKEMGNLLNSHEPPGFAHENESPKPSTKLKKGKKPKSKVPLVSPDRIEFLPKKHKTTRVNFD